MSSEAYPQWGVRLGRGVVTYFNDEPLVTWEQAVQAREKIEAATGEWGEVEKVYMLTHRAGEAPAAENTR
jgi:hypothetical protein